MASALKSFTDILISSRISKSLDNILDVTKLIGDTFSSKLATNLLNNINGGSFKSINNNQIADLLNSDVKNTLGQLDQANINKLADDIYNTIDRNTLDNFFMDGKTAIDVRNEIVEQIRKYINDVEPINYRNLSDNIFTVKTLDSINDLENYGIIRTEQGKIIKENIPPPRNMDDIPDEKVNEKLEEFNRDINNLNKNLSGKTYDELKQEIINNKDSLFKNYGKMKVLILGSLFVSAAVLISVAIVSFLDKSTLAYTINDIKKYKKNNIIKLKLSFTRSISNLCNEGIINVNINNNNIVEPNINGEYKLENIECLDDGYSILITPNVNITKYPQTQGNYGRITYKTSFYTELKCKKDGYKDCVSIDDYELVTNDENSGGDGGSDGDGSGGGGGNGDGSGGDGSGGDGSNGDGSGGGGGNGDGSGGDGSGGDGSENNSVIYKIVNYIKNNKIYFSIIFIIIFLLFIKKWLLN